MTVSQTSIEALKILANGKMEGMRLAVYHAICELGPTFLNEITEYLNAKEAAACKPKQFRRQWIPSWVTGRIDTLVKNRYIWSLGEFRGNWKGKIKPYKMYKTMGDLREPQDRYWFPYVKKDKQTIRINPVIAKQRIQENILHKMAAGEAGRTLVEYKRFKNQQITQPTSQLLLFA